MLTDLSCKALIKESKHQNKPIKQADARGLFLHAFPSGSALWKHRYRIAGKEKEIAYGPYPVIGLSEARERHGESYKLIRKGIDPSKLRQDEARNAIVKAEKEAGSIFKVVALAWFDHNLEKWSERHARRLKNRMVKNLFPGLSEIPIEQITRKQLLNKLRIIEQRSKEAAKRCAQYLDGIFGYARDEEYVETNIASDFKDSLKPIKHGHYASMDIDALPDFLKRLDGEISGDAETKRDAINLIMLTLVRSMELLSAEWTEFDFDRDIWMVPASKMKMKKPHMVPLSPQAKAILLKRRNANFSPLNLYPSKYVFPSESKPGKHVCHTTISNTLIEMGYSGIHTSHGFRALGMGIARERLGYRRVIPNRQLAHEPKGDVNRAYDRAKFLKKRVKMMNELADYIDEQKLNTDVLKMEIKNVSSFSFSPIFYGSQYNA